MPLHDFKCEICDETFELILTIHDDVDKQECPRCLSPVEHQIPLVSMHPDNMWAGQVTSNAGYVTSKSRYMKILKENNIEITTSRKERESIANKIAKAKQEKKIKSEVAIENTLHETLRGVEFPSPDSSSSPLNVGLGEVKAY